MLFHIEFRFLGIHLFLRRYLYLIHLSILEIKNSDDSHSMID